MNNPIRDIEQVVKRNEVIDTNGHIDISIVIPAFNEGHQIEATVNNIQRYLSSVGYKYELIIVNDGSTDNTVELVNALARTNRNIKLLDFAVHKGKGFAVKSGILEANGDYAFFYDADSSVHIKEIDRLLKLLQNGYEVVITSRYLDKKNFKNYRPKLRSWLSKIYNYIFQILIIKGIKDTQCGFKGFKKQFIKEIFKRQSLNGYAFDIEILYIAKKNGYKIKEIPIDWYSSSGSKVNIWKDSIYMFFDLIKVAIKKFLGK
jgi:dolichyl-phosphate beta-glucosyltransferase